MTLSYYQEIILFSQQRVAKLNLTQCEFFIVIARYNILLKVTNNNITKPNECSCVTHCQNKNKQITNNIFCSRFADQVSVGDEVMVLDNDKLRPEKVINISDLIMQGNCTFFLIS